MVPNKDPTCEGLCTLCVTWSDSYRLGGGAHLGRQSARLERSVYLRKEGLRRGERGNLDVSGRATEAEDKRMVRTSRGRCSILGITDIQSKHFGRWNE